MIVHDKLAMYALIISFPFEKNGMGFFRKKSPSFNAKEGLICLLELFFTGAVCTDFLDVEFYCQFFVFDPVDEKCLYRD